MVNCIVIDDDPDIVSIFCELLSLHQVDVLSTGIDGKDAVELYEKFNPDIVFTDLDMPKYDGYYAVENIKDRNSFAKIIVITGDINARFSGLFRALHIPVITKPFDMNGIKQAIGDSFLAEKNEPMSFEIQYRFKEDPNLYSCIVTYEQYRNFKKLPIIYECNIAQIEQESSELEQIEVQNALNLAIKNDISHIRNLSEIITDD
ncbi:response regulator receiver domain protein [Candidatus Nitrosopumilus salaria BD31]|uniref:Response regulator receiver domain protein n=1 Tax=Candidatus Nitrosopumilus salarius BD31 TaxID=859350 RepID=I3D195_9ARCH|nr:response regulator [Candidatus Nitrosopumilus salaria]EIJ65488.1 response regulator receiver domain protein [Candidatus Nitrosopumilus salaria BD31]